MHFRIVSERRGKVAAVPRLEFYSLKQTAEMLMLSERTVRRLIQEKKLRVFKPRGVWKIPYDAIVEFYVENCYW
jgi:excisionase family DNA binding protein